MESRGYAEVGDDPSTRSPRTIGADVIAIAAVLDPVVRATTLRFGGSGLARRWRACVDDLEQLALTTPDAEYVENRAFWSTLSAMCVYLHAQAVRLPEAHVLEALLAQISERLAYRNGPSGDGPFKKFDAKTHFDLYLAQRDYLAEQRGKDLLDPEAGMAGGKQLVPRTTNSDILALAGYWSKELDDAKDVSGTAGVEKRWREVLVDVFTIARVGDPSAVYPTNHAFWRVLSKTASHVGGADATLSRSEMMIDSLKDSIKDLPKNIVGGVKVLANEVGKLAGSAAHSVGKLAHEAGKGLFTGFGTPLLIGAGLVGLYLVSRTGKREGSEA
ncbi:MAG: hypothetical protein KF773_12300 [Deltaproteobacteria bacterium]|nr:hypothetical protein [Deltaproteobacteria bacterium]